MMTSHGLNWMLAGVLFLLLVTAAPAGASTRTSIVDPNATVFIGEQGLNITSVMGDEVWIAWYTSTQNPNIDSPTKLIDVSSTKLNFFVSPSDFVGYDGWWFKYNTTTSTNTGDAFTVRDPDLFLYLNDTTTGTINPSSVVQGDELSFDIRTNMSRIASLAPPFMPTSTRINRGGDVDGYIDIKVREDSTGTVFTSLYNNTQLPQPLLGRYVDTYPYQWSYPCHLPYSWSTGVVIGGVNAYRPGSYTVWAESNLNGMKDNYKNAGADYVGKTVSARHTFILEGVVHADYAVNIVSGTKPLTVEFTDLSTGGPLMWMMDFGDGNGASGLPGAKFTWTYTSEGVFFPKINATNSITTDNRTNATISVNILPFSDPNQAKAYNVMLNDPTILNGNTAGKSVSANTTKMASGAKSASPWGSKPAIALPADKAGWFFFIDDNPDANWEHPCRYVFVDDTSTPVATAYNAMSPPTNIAVAPIAGELPDPGGTVLGGGGGAGGAPACSPDCSHYYALLLSGGYNANNNHKRYYNDILSMYTTLTQTYGYPKNHIWVLMSDGTLSTADRHYADDTTKNPVVPKLDNSPTATDFAGSTIGNAQKATVLSTLGSIATALGPTDNLFIFTTNHGASTTTPASESAILYLWNGESITDEEFVNALDPELNSITITMEQCFSGGFIDNFITNYAGPQKRVIATAANYNEYSWGNAFSYPWIFGVTNPVPSDTSGDSRGSMQEAFTYARDHDDYATMVPAKETPQFFYKNIDGSAQFLADCAVVPTVRVTVPNTAETWYTGTPRTISWTQTALEGKTVTIELWKGTPGTKTATIATVDATAGSYLWPTIPTTLVAASDYWIKIYQTDNTAVFDKSDVNFIISRGGGTGTGSIKVTSVPVQGATIILNQVGLPNPPTSTNTTLSGIVAGTNYVGVSQAGYYTVPVSTVKVTVGGTVPADFVLEPLQANDCPPYGRLVVTSIPIQDAKVFINGKYRGINTNGEVELAPGTYMVSVERDGYVTPPAYQVTIAEPECGKDRTTYAEFTFDPKPAWYTFDGFAPPITMGAVNNANAGQTVPVKWHLLDRFGIDPVTDPASFVALKSYPVTCSGYTGNPDQAVTESGPGASGLKYAGSGNWQANWKTPKAYAGTCRNLFVAFNSGQTSPEVTFKFK